MKYTPEKITELESHEIFVFGSNESGIHGAGAAFLAKTEFGATDGQGFGPSGHTFAIPTKDWHILPLPLDVINFYVDRFIVFAARRSGLEFLVTKIGTGLAGFPIKDIAPMFRLCLELKNVTLPKEFHDYYEKH